MTVSIWRITADTRDYTADDLTGAGAKKTGGRWNHPDTPMLYCASNIALACLETIVHIAAGSLPLNRYLVRIDVPADVWGVAQVLTAASAPVGWDALPEGRVSLDYGTQWAMSKSTALLCVPSTVVPEEWSVLVNPEHADAVRMTATKLRRCADMGMTRAA